MNISGIPTPKTTSNLAKRKMIIPVIPLARPDRPDLKKNECLSFKLRSNPNDEQSTTYELTIAFFSGGAPEDLLLFLKNLNKVMVGQNITSGPNMFSLVRRLLQGDALAAFNNAASETGAETVVNFRLCLQKLKTHVFPKKPLMTQKTFMRRFLKKPRDMKVREFMTRLIEMNEYLADFPPFEPNQKLSHEDLMDIAEYAMPATWLRNMHMHGFDATSHTSSEFVEFNERIELYEPKDLQGQAKSKTGKNGNQVCAKSSERGNSKRKRDKWCEYHKSDSHDTNECKVMLAQAKKMRGQWEAKISGEPQHKHKTWHKNQGKPTKENFHAEMKEVMKETLKELLVSKKKEAEAESFTLDAFKNFKLGEESEEE